MGFEFVYWDLEKMERDMGKRSMLFISLMYYFTTIY